MSYFAALQVAMYLAYMDADLILSHVGKHISLDRGEVDLFLSFLQPLGIKRKAFLLRANEICRYESFVNKGCLRSYYIDENGFEHVVEFAVEGWWTGDLASFLTQSPAVHHVDALEDSEVLQISKDKLEELYRCIPKFERFFRILFQNALVTCVQRLMHSHSFTAEQRYLRFTKKYPSLEQRVAQKQIAAYLGITPEYLSGLRHKMSKSRIVS